MTDDYRDNDAGDSSRRQDTRHRKQQQPLARDEDYATTSRVREMIEAQVPKIVKIELISLLQTIGLNLSTFESTSAARNAIAWAFDSVNIQDLRKKERYKAVLFGVASLIVAIAVPFAIWVLAKYKDK